MTLVVVLDWFSNEYSTGSSSLATGSYSDLWLPLVRKSHSLKSISFFHLVLPSREMMHTLNMYANGMGWICPVAEHTYMPKNIFFVFMLLYGYLSGFF